MTSESDSAMSLRELCRLGRQELVDRYRRGELSPHDFWVACKGAAEYAAAVASGDLCRPRDHQARSESCFQCPHAAKTEGEDGMIKVWCGVPFEGPEPLCGCLVALRVKGQILPGALTAVASASCPLPNPRWRAVDRIG